MGVIRAPGGRLHRRRGRHYGCRERHLPVLLPGQSMARKHTKDDSRRLKLVTGVDISTRPVRRSERVGKAEKRNNLRAAAKL